MFLFAYNEENRGVVHSLMTKLAEKARPGALIEVTEEEAEILKKAIHLSDTDVLLARIARHLEKLANPSVGEV